ncbi:hypothetical protein [Stappia stellulata]|uniref:hypothetical protein n=1 Tax=Stappia stellulata TaxID=71235 RepID=UPI00041104CB|nr:hypothetical protein [Stappia stellulata]
MMTNYEKYHPYSPVALWVSGVLVFSVTLGAGVAAIGSHADAMPRPERLASVSEIIEEREDCSGVIFRDADPACFAVRDNPHPDTVQARNDRNLQDPGEAAGS